MTLAASGSEMNNYAVVTNEEKQAKNEHPKYSYLPNSICNQPGIASHSNQRIPGLFCCRRFLHIA